MNKAEEEQERTQPKPRRPWDATVCIQGIWYKRGRHGLVFKWIGGQWVNSTRKPHELDRYRD